MVKAKLPCPRCSGPGSSSEPLCAVCHGRGTVRVWHVAVTVDRHSRAHLVHLPDGVTIADVSKFPTVVLKIERHRITEALDLAIAALSGPNGEEPFVHRAW